MPWLTVVCVPGALSIPVSPGHMFLVIQNDDGSRAYAAGFNPIGGASPLTAIPGQFGHVTYQDDAFYPITPSNSTTIYISPAQQAAIQAFADHANDFGYNNILYQVPGHDCVDFVWAALAWAGIYPPGGSYPIRPGANINVVRQAFLDSDAHSGAFPNGSVPPEPLIPDAPPFAQERGGDLEQAQGGVQGSTGVGDPLIIGLTPDGVSTTALGEYGTFFGENGTGRSFLTAWAAIDSGLLVSVDQNGNPHLFSGFAQVASLDGNGDGQIDSSDTGFATLAVWQDYNEDGKPDPGEITSLAALGIKSVSLSYAPASQNQNGNTVTGIGLVTMVDGTTRELASVDLATSSTYTESVQAGQVPPEIRLLPQLHGYGTLSDLQSQMASDPTLVALVNSFQTLASSNPSVSQLRAATDAILFRWAGVDGVDPSSRGEFDARRLEVIESALGEHVQFPLGYYGSPSNPGLLPSLLAN